MKDRKAKVFVVKSAGGPVTTTYLKSESNAADNAQEHADKVDVPSVIEKDRQQDQDTKVPTLGRMRNFHSEVVATDEPYL